ncbi:MAG: M48 family metalloprotease [Acidobacteria bacterium]|nr:M48 family metalloprotease [Acidobacteriota bacterium]
MPRSLVIAAFVLLSLTPDLALAQKTQTFHGYAEWHRGDVLIVDGQQIRANGGTALKGAARGGFESIELGSEVTVKGTRLGDGTILAREIEAKPNGVGMFESTIVNECDSQEQQWLRDGEVTEEDGDGSVTRVGRVHETGAQVDRVNRIVDRITPSYVDRSRFRVYVVDSKEWNAMAMANGSIWVFRGLLDAMDDDEMALVVGHEMAHVTHEHLNRDFKKGLWVQGLSLAALLAAETIDNGKARVATQIASMATAMAFENHFSRESEEQADRVGLRYAYEGGYDPNKAPRLWERFREKYGDDMRVLNFFFGSHPRE